MFTVNKFGNCGSDLLGSGTRSCDIKSFGDVLGINLHTKGFRLAKDTGVASELWTTSLKELKTFPYHGIYNFDQTTPENEKATSSSGVMSEIRIGKPQFTFEFDKGGCFHKSLFNKRNKAWDLSLNFEAGILLANIDEDNIGGFDMGMFSVETFRLLQGTDPQRSLAMVQLIDAVQFNADHVFFTWEELGVNLNRVNGVVETIVEVVEVNDDEVTVKVASACNVDDIIPDLDDPEHWALSGDLTTPTTISTVSYDASTGLYTIALADAPVDGDTIQFTLVDDSYSVAEDATGNLYKGQSVLFDVEIPSE